MATDNELFRVFLTFSIIWLQNYIIIGNYLYKIWQKIIKNIKELKNVDDAVFAVGHQITNWILMVYFHKTTPLYYFYSICLYYYVKIFSKVHGT